MKTVELKKRVWACAGRLLGLPRCPVCGVPAVRRQVATIDPQLRREWELDDVWAARFAKREGLVCGWCWSSERIRHLARVLTELSSGILGYPAATFTDFLKGVETKGLRVAEINACGQLHPYLNRLSTLFYSEFGSSETTIPSEDLLALSYPADFFDLVLTSDTLEHVPDIERAGEEIYRVLKPGGRHVCTIPVVWDRPVTRRRCRLEAGQLVHYLPASYHGGTPGYGRSMVVYEFGADIEKQLQESGFAVEIDVCDDNPANCVFICRKPPVGP
jgi:SAM-dependent methyltransferase